MTNLQFVKRQMCDRGKINHLQTSLIEATRSPVSSKLRQPFFSAPLAIWSFGSQRRNRGCIARSLKWHPSIVSPMRAASPSASCRASSSSVPQAKLSNRSLWSGNVPSIYQNHRSRGAAQAVLASPEVRQLGAPALSWTAMRSPSDDRAANVRPFICRGIRL